MAGILSGLGYGLPSNYGTPYQGINEFMLGGTLLANQGANRGGGTGAAYFNYLADIYGSDTAARIAEINGMSAQEVERIRQGGALDVSREQGYTDRYQADTQYDIAGLNDATNRYGIDSAERLGQYKTGGDIYGQELAYDLGQSRNATDRYGKDVEKYGLDIGREVAGMREQGETGRAHIGASQGALTDILRDNRRGQMLSSPLVASMLGTNFSGLMGNAMNALSGTPAAATSTAQKFSAPNAYDAESTVASLLSQITGNGQPQMDYPKAGPFTPSTVPQQPGIAQRPTTPTAPTGGGGYQAPQRPPTAPPNQTPIPIPEQTNNGPRMKVVEPKPLNKLSPQAMPGFVAPTQQQLDKTAHLPYPVKW